MVHYLFSYNQARVSVTYENCATHAHVERGRDWSWGTQDHHNGNPGKGIITHCGSKWAKVKWDGGIETYYRIDDENNLGLYYVAGNYK